MAKRIDEANPQGLIGKDLDPRRTRHSATASALSLRSGSPAIGNASRVEVPYRIVGILERETGPFGGTAAVSGLMIPLGRAKAIVAATRALTQALVPERANDRAYNALIVKVQHAQSTQDVEDQIKKKGFSRLLLERCPAGCQARRSSFSTSC